MLGRTLRPLTFVVSLSLPEPASITPVASLLERYPTLRFKLDGKASWDERLIAALRATGAIDSIDYKGQYKGTVVDTPAAPDWYRRIAEGFPDAWLEDPDLDADGIAEVPAGIVKVLDLEGGNI